MTSSPGFDVVVVGAGTAGCVVAARLSQDPACRVALLEAGGPPSDPDIDDPLLWTNIQGRAYDWAYRTVPQPHTAGRVHDWPRGKVVGGSGCLHAMAYVRGHPRDFDTWAAAGGARWSWDGLRAGFDRSATLLPGTGGPLDVWLPEAEVSPLVRAYIAAGTALGVPAIPGHNRGLLVGTTPNSLNIRAGRRLTLAGSHLTPEVLARPNLTLLTGHCADRMDIEARVLWVDGPDGMRRISAGRIVLALGAVGTPLLLFRSGVGDPRVLAAAGIECRMALPGVGRNLQDHLLVAGTVYSASRPVPPSRLQHSESLMYLDSRVGFGASDGPPDVVLGCVVAPTAAHPDGLPAYGDGYTLLSGQTHPKSRGSLTPTGPARSDPPLIDPQYLSHPDDRAAMRRALRMARDLGTHAALDGWRRDEVLPGKTVQSDAALDDFVARHAITHHHPAGTCRMGTDSAAVVDGDLRLGGTNGVFVVDASVIPTLPSGPINAAVAAIAETWSALAPDLA